MGLSAFNILGTFFHGYSLGVPERRLLSETISTGPGAASPEEACTRTMQECRGEEMHHYHLQCLFSIYTALVGLLEPTGVIHVKTGPNFIYCGTLEIGKSTEKLFKPIGNFELESVGLTFDIFPYIPNTDLG